MQFSIFQESRRGARRTNQDRVAHCHTEDSLLMLVADGMGGHLHGEIAAELASGFITDAFRREATPVLPDPALFLRRAIIGAHHAIIRHAADAGLAGGPRTTCVACVIQDNVACWAHAGDSRLYHVRKGLILAKTKDHSRVQQLIDQGRIREESVAAHPERNRIFSCLGSDALPQLAVSTPTRVDAGDTLMLCSDGVWGPLSPRIIGDALQAGDIAQGIAQLLDEAERRAGRECDNLSAVAVRWE